MKSTRRQRVPERRGALRGRHGLAGAATVVLFALVACSGGGSDAGGSPDAATPAGSPGASDAPSRQDADLVIWTTEPASRAVTPIAKKFGQENGISVAVQVIASDLAANAITANAAGNGPDIVTLPNDFLGGALQNGAVAPLSLTADDLSAYDEGAVTSVTRNDQVWALPYGTENLVLYRNTDAVAKAPSTVEDLVGTGQAAVGKGKVKRALALPVGQEGDAYHLYAFFSSAGGSLFGKKPDGQYDPEQVGIGDEASVKAAQKIAALGEKGSKVLSRSIDGTNAIAQFTEGKSAYLVSGPWALADIRKSEVSYDITPIPGFQGEAPAAPFLGVQAFWTLSNAKNPAFAEEFVTKTMNTPEAMTAMYDEDPRPPARTDVLKAVSAKDPDMAKLAAGAKNASLLPDFPFMAGVWPALSQAFASIVGGEDPAATMTSAGTAIRSAVTAP
ncbi:extracellular solute-binding protein [Kineosporia sp. NBRC 101731]|uniref:sugar ABC transporter substrate-binding protein n=1 Tax=Kineosporia sp. NBRC 101731 TaxID=3032199 RepID=UPI0024A02BAF|nr:extracellular solute-binding protein [Kineosporia sp. NBRC 101731]GLY29686.1 sugar ABC transporter substrate-binding protein [Kineosporia sp. NBRC 101731]